MGTMLYMVQKECELEYSETPPPSIHNKICGLPPSLSSNCIRIFGLLLPHHIHDHLFGA